MTILCIDINALKTSQEVQKDVDLEDLLNNHTKYFDSEEEALKADYAPLNFSVSTRSVYTNLVMQTTDSDGKKYYTNLTQIQPFIHKGYDLIMYLASIGLMHNISYSAGFDEVMVKHSCIKIIGLYNPDPRVVNPIIYSHIIIEDGRVDKFSEYLNDNVELVPISVMNENRAGNIPALLDTLIEVKGEKTDE